jgi:hypothetical protein
MSLKPQALAFGLLALALVYAALQGVAMAYRPHIQPQTSAALQFIDLMSFIPFVGFVVAGFVAGRVAEAAGLLHGAVIAVLSCGVFYWPSIARLFAAGYGAPVHPIVISVIGAILGGCAGELYALRAKAEA